MSILISLIKYAWCKMMAGFWGKVADATKPKTEAKNATPEGGERRKQ